MKIIEEGCLAVMINSRVPENIGKCVKVLKFIGSVDRHRGLDRWIVDGEVLNNLGEKVSHQRECYLMRIGSVRRNAVERIAAPCYVS